MAEEGPVQRTLQDLFIRWLSLSNTEYFLKSAVNEIRQKTVKPELKLNPPASLSPRDTKRPDTLIFDFKDIDSEGKDTPKELLSPQRPTDYLRPSPLNTVLSRPSTSSISSPSPPRSPAVKRSPISRFTPSPKSTKHGLSPSSMVIKQFYFPNGIPLSPTSKAKSTVSIKNAFASHPNGLSIDNLFPVTMQICGLPSYCNNALFEKLDVEHNNVVTEAAFTKFWSQELEKFDVATRFFRLLRKPGAPHLSRDDFKPIVQEIVNRHPGLEFLESTPEFQLRYAQTVIARIFYQVNKAGNEKLTPRELKKSNFLVELARLDVEDDINKVNDYFSYEHFYVIYLKFWELDVDHDSYIDGADLLKYDDYALTPRVVDRIMGGHPRKLLCNIPGKMGYDDFVVFLISEVDKTSEISLDYWFRCIDVDGDGSISAQEIDFFFQEQRPRMQALSQEPVLFPDILCQMVDMIKPSIENQFNKNDLQRSKMASLFFNMLFNMNKFIQSEQRDPIRIRHVHNTPQYSDWDRWAISGYYQLAGGEEEPDEYGGNRGPTVDLGEYLNTPAGAEADMGAAGGAAGGGGGGDAQHAGAAQGDGGNAADLHFYTESTAK